MPIALNKPECNDFRKCDFRGLERFHHREFTFVFFLLN
jgi:hypothetical protein